MTRTATGPRFAGLVLTRWFTQHSLLGVTVAAVVVIGIAIAVVATPLGGVVVAAVVLTAALTWQTMRPTEPVRETERRNRKPEDYARVKPGIGVAHVGYRHGSKRGA